MRLGAPWKVGGHRYWRETVSSSSEGSTMSDVTRYRDKYWFWEPSFLWRLCPCPQPQVEPTAALWPVPAHHLPWLGHQGTWGPRHRAPATASSGRGREPPHSTARWRETPLSAPELPALLLPPALGCQGPGGGWSRSTCRQRWLWDAVWSGALPAVHPHLCPQGWWPRPLPPGSCRRPRKAELTQGLPGEEPRCVRLGVGWWWNF